MNAREHKAATTPAAGSHTGPAQGRYGDLIAHALATEGGHLAIGRGAWLSGHDAAAAKRECVGAGLPVIDSRSVPLDRAAMLAISGPMVAVGHAPCPEPHHALSYAPLALVAERYRAAGAEVLNLPAP